MTIAEYLRLPWTVVRSEHDDDGHYVALHVPELPGFVVAARSEVELEGMFWPALEAFLQSYLSAGEEPPAPNRVPRTVRLPDALQAYDSSLTREAFQDIQTTVLKG